MNALIASNVRRFRQERDLSLGELARRAHLSKQTLSKIEQGEGNPTIDTLQLICDGLGVSMGAVLATYGSNVKLIPAEQLPFAEHRIGVEARLDRIYGTGYVETAVFELAGQATEPIGAHSRGTLHQVYVIDGAVRIGGEFESVDLSRGDFFRFPGDVEHSYLALEQNTRLHVTTTAPQVAQFEPLR